MKSLGTLYEIYQKGDSLNDEELIALMNHCYLTYQNLDELRSDMFALVRNELCRTYYSLRGFATSRGLIKD